MGTITERTIARFIVELFKKMKRQVRRRNERQRTQGSRSVLLLVLGGKPGKRLLPSCLKTLGIPISTAHRAVSQLIHKGWLKDSPHPEDGRKRVVELSEQGVAGGLWSQGIEWLKLYSELVPVPSAH